MNLKIIFAGTPDFAVPVFQELLAANYNILAVYTQPDRPAGRGKKLRASPIKQLAMDVGLPVEQPSTLRCDKEQRILQSYHGDIMIVVAYGLILPQRVLSSFPIGCINIHASLLPRWRGAAPIQRAILEGDQVTGISIMKMEAGLDTGPVYYQAKISIDPLETAQSLHDKLAELGAKTLLECLPAIKTQQLSPKPQIDHATYAPKITKEEARIAWHQSAEFIHRAIRAFNPWPVAFTQINDQWVRVWEGTMISTAVTDKAGKILRADKNGIQVAAGSGIVNLTRLQLAGGKILSAHEILNAKRELFQSGTFFS